MADTVATIFHPSRRPMGPSWTSHLSEQGDARLEVKDGAMVIHSRAHHCAFAERDLPSGTTMIQCRINSGTDQGMTWGPGLGLVWPGEFLRINLRPPEGLCGVDNGHTQGLYRTGIEPNKDYYVRRGFSQGKCLRKFRTTDRSGGR